MFLEGVYASNCLPVHDVMTEMVLDNRIVVVDQGRPNRGDGRWCALVHHGEETYFTASCLVSIFQ